jgi:hypothetical protein
MTSTDGITWMGRNSTILTTGNGVAYGQDESGAGLWVVVGRASSTNSIATSYDGITWTGRTGATGVTGQGKSVTYANGLWVATFEGDNSIATSTNGINWTVKNNPLINGAYGVVGPTKATLLTNYYLPTKKMGDASFNIIPPTSNNYGAITYTSSNTAVATIVGSKINVIGVGTSTITAVQEETFSYLSGTNTSTFQVIQSTEGTETVLSDFSLPTKIIGDASFDIVVPTTNSDGSFVYTSSNIAVATIVGSTVTIVGVGTSTITAIQLMTSTYASATITAPLVVNQITTVLSNFSVPTKTFGDVSFGIIAPTTNGNGTFSYASSDTTVVTISGNRITVVGGGSSTITATQSSTTNYTSATITAPITVNQATTVLANFSIGPKTIADASFTIPSITTNSTGLFSYTSSDPTVATVAGNVATIVGIGSATITADQASNANYLAQTISTTLSVSRNLWVAVGYGTENTVASSYDGIVWKGLGLGGSPQSIAYSNNLWVAVGSGANTVAYSTTNGNKWTGFGKTVFSTAGYRILYDSDAALWIAIGQGGNSIATSTTPKTSWTGQGSIFPSATCVYGPATNYSGAQNLSAYLLGGYSTGSLLAYSLDGTTWQMGTTSGLACQGFNTIAYGNGIYVAGGTPIGSGNSFATSTDQITWTGRGGSTLMSNVNQITYGNGIFIATGTKGTAGSTIMKSTDGVTWTNLTNVYGSYSGRCVAYYQGRWIVGGGAYYGINYSDDNGTTWNYTSTSYSIYSTQTNAIAYGNDIVVSVGQGTVNTLAISTNMGVSWTGKGLLLSGSGNDVKYNDGLWLAVGGDNVSTGNIIVKSTDNGTTWTQVATHNTSYFTSLSSVQNVNGTWYISGRGAYYLAYSNTSNPTSISDFVMVSTVSFTTNGASLSTFNYQKPKYIVGGKGMKGSVTGLSWFDILNQPFTKVNDVYWNGTIWVGVGEYFSTVRNTIAYSYDGINWVGIGATIFTTSGNNVYYSTANSLWIATGTGTNTLATSVDGINWTGRGTTVFTTAGGRITYYNNLLIGVGEGSSKIATSTDGISWDTNARITTGRTVVYINNQWVVAGDGTSNFATSTNGMIWRDLKPTITNGVGSIYSIAYGNGIWVAVGYGKMMYSTDGINWTGSASNAGINGYVYKVAYGQDGSGNGLWVAAGSGYTNPISNSIATSTDGITWTSRNTNSNFPFNSNGNFGCRGVAYGNGLWVAVGIGTNAMGANSIATSTNGITWTSRNSNGFSNGQGVAYANGLWVAVGNGGTSTSTDGITWTGRSSYGYYDAGANVAYGNGLWVSVGYGQSFTSPDGITWTARVHKLTTAYDVAYSNGLWVICGSLSLSSSFVSTSTDGITWTLRNESVFTHKGFDVVGPADTVTKITSVLSNFSVPVKTFGDASFSLVAPTTNSDGVITYTSSNPAVATIVDNVVTIVRTGSTTITAYQANTSNYSVGTITATFTVNKITTVLTDFAVPTKTFADASFSLVAPTTNSDGAITYTSSNAAVATVSGSRITIIGGGTATITATQATTPIYEAQAITASFLVNQKTTVLSNFSVITKTFGDASFNLVAPTTNSTGSFTYTSSNTTVATIAGSTVTIVGTGTVTITANQASNANFLAETITTTMTVIQAIPTITKLDIPAKIIGTAPFALVAPITNSTGAFTYTTSDESVATINGNTVTIVGLGITTITAIQASTANYISGTISAPLAVVTKIPLTIATGQGGNSIATSTDLGFTWTGRGTTLSAGYGVAGPATYDVSTAYANFWITGGWGSGGNTFATSTDGITLTGVGQNSNNIYGFACANNLLVLVGGGYSMSSIAYSTNGITWNNCLGDVFAGSFYGTGYSVAYGAGLWVAAGNGGNTIATSTNGINWVGRGSPVTYSGRGVAFGKDGSGNNLWVVVGAEGSGNRIASSPDGITWTVRSADYAIFSTSNGVAFGKDGSGNNLWVAVGTINTIATSTNGTNWVGRGASVFTTQGWCVAYGQDGSGAGLWVAVGEGGNSIATSTNGLNWTGRGTTIFTNFGRGVAYANNQWFAVGSGGNFYATSIDGINWTGRGGSNVFGGWYPSVSCVAYAQLEYTKPTYVAVGTGTNTIVSSLNGTTWTSPYPSPFTTTGFSVAWNGISWVAVGSGVNTIAYSADGIRWTGNNTIITTQATAVVYGKDGSGNGLWVSGGYGGNSIATSTNGIIWTGRGATSIINPCGIAYGKDGSGNGLWVAVGGGNTIATSTNGIIWTGRGATVFTSVGYAVTYANNLWVAVGAGGNTIATSRNGTTWTGLGLIMFTQGNGIRYTNNLWIASGQGGGNTIATSVDGTKWVGRGSTLFTTAGRGLIGPTAVEPALTFTVPIKNIGDAPFTITPPTTNSSGSFTYTSSNTEVATIDGITVTIVGMGTSTITAVQESTDYFISGTVSTSLVVENVKPVVTDFSVPEKTFGDAAFSVVAPTSNSDGIFTYTSSNTAVATVAGSTITIVSAGTSTITASQAITADYGSAKITAALTVNKATPTITNFSAITKTFGNAAFSLVAPTSNSTGAFTYTSSNTAVATIVGSTVTIVGGGTATITATQATTTNYLAGTTTATLTVNKATTILSNFSAITKTFGNAAFSIVAPTSNSAGSFTYTSSNTEVATIAGSTVTIVGVGTATITASQATTTNYLAGTITATMTVSKATPIITIFDVPAKAIGTAPFSLVAPTSNSSGAFTYTSSNTSVATMDGSMVTIVGLGNTTITAVQASTTNYLSGSITGIFSIMVNVPLSIAVGSGGNSIATSTDRGLTWTGRTGTTVFSTSGSCVAFGKDGSGNNLLVAVGQGGNTIATSTNGTTWIGRGASVFTSQGIGVTYANNLWVAVGQGTNSIATSTDGVVWTGRGTSIFSNQGIGVAFNNGLWVAVGQGTNSIATSTDGVIWTGRTGTSIFSNKGICVAFNNGLWVAVGDGTNSIATSTNGTVWTGRGKTALSGLGRGVAYGNGLWVAVGQGSNTIATSPDGITWTGRTGTSIFSIQGIGVAFNSGLWIAVGQGTNSIATSPDGLVWTGRGTSIFSTSGFGVTVGIITLPAISSISPSSGAIVGGTNVTITGTNFTGATSVKFDGIVATSLNIVNSTTITCITPARSAGAVGIIVTTEEGPSGEFSSFTYITPPSITGISPSSGSTEGGTSVTITGTSFIGATSVTFDGIAATSLNIVNSTTITCVTPARSTGAVGIIVTTLYGTSGAFSPFTYITPPVISSISSSSGSTEGGTNVTIRGTNFTGATSVTFGGLSATSLSIVNSTTITCITPACTTGAVGIIVTTGGGPSDAFSSFTYITPPSITDISPSSGSTVGGTNVTITGTNFTGATLVTFGGLVATNINVVNNTTITCVTPARSTGAGAVGIIVTTGGGPSGAFSSFTYITPPVVTSISPLTGSTAGGTSVTITGTSFTAATLVTFSGLAATSLSVVNSTTITCITPVRSTGAAGIIVKTLYGTSGAFSSFTYIAPPVISRISSSSGGIAGGTNVTITGKNFTGATLVTFGGIAATSLSVVNSTTITCITPANNAGAVGIIVTTGGGPSGAFSSFTYVTPPNITGISQLTGSTAGGTSVTITGTSFTGATSVTFDGIAATSLSVVDSTTITCSTPAHITGDVGIIVTTLYGTSNTFSPFTYITPPNITGISSSYGSTAGGTNVTITGTNFTGATLVTFGGLSATSLSIVNSTTITCITPARTTAGDVGIIVTTGGGPSGAFSSFTYITPPNITGISPPSGSIAGGTSVTITGTNFTGATSVTFDGIAATSISVVNNTTITCITPARTTAGSVDIIVTTGGGSSGAFSSFTYITSSVISSISPSSGSTAGGTNVTITGTNFTGATSVTFDGIAATTINVVNSTTITCITPAHSDGAVGIIVTTGGGPSDAFSSFTYITPSVISSISPSSGINTGGTNVTITGTNFTGATLVTFGGIAATSLSILDSTTISCITPAVLSDGAVDIIVTTGGGPSGAFSSFTYITSPVISSISPSSGGIAGGTNVTITGINFTGATSVSFDGLSATSLSIVNSTTITCITPAHNAGAVGIIVTAEGGPSGEFSSFTYITPPNITGILSSSGSTLGGTNITITGTNFTGATSVTFGGIAATSLSVVNNTTITCITPAHNTGDVGIIVTTEGGSSGAFLSFTYITPPNITDISQLTGSTAGGTNVTITGTSFIGATSVTFGGIAATSLSIVDSTTITCITPAHITGAVGIIVTTGGGPSGAFSQFTYITPPNITSISQLTGSTLGGTSVTITGTSFTGATSVTFGGLSATSISVVNNTTITCITPARTTAGAVGIIVTTGGGPSNTFSPFTYITPPSITGISQLTGSTLGGTNVTITGTSFTGATSVTFDGLSATTINVVNSTTITCITPARTTAGAVGIIVTTEYGSGDAFLSFTYITPPVVTSISPLSGSTAGGTSVTITGTSFTGATSVTLGGIAATSLSVVNNTTITCITPARSDGAVGIIVTTLYGTSNTFSSFTYIAPPNITGISQLTGSTAGGTSVTITGTSFTGATSVTFGGIAATSLSIVNSTTITCITPARATVGAVGVIVITGGGPSTTFSSFTYIIPPNIKSILPLSVSRVGGTSVTITGTNFIGATSVTLDGLSATSFNVVNNTSITCITPARTTGGMVGVIVTTGGGPSNTLSTFIYVPFVSAILPKFGTRSGGTIVKITGIGFTGATSVTFGGIPATNLFVFNPTTITCKTPAGVVAGDVGVIVSTRDGPSNTFSSFTYITPPNITGISPSYGGTVGGMNVTITGKSFTGVSSVLFGGVKVKSLKVIDDTTITCVTAPRPTPGDVSITVQNSIGISNVFSSYTYIITPKLTSISPNFGSTTGGNTVTIIGTDFIGATEVTVGDLSCSSFTVIDNNTLTCITPARIAPGPVGIIVTTGGGPTKKSSPFTYILPPVLTSISPPFGSTTGGNVVTITGINFKGASSVLFGEFGATLVKAVNDTTITCKTPAQIVAGPFDVIVRTGGGPSNTFSSFMYITPPVISDISPPAGSTLGGNIVTITGTNLTGATSVLFGKAASTNITVVDDTTLTCRTPLNKSGAPGVIVRTGGGPSTIFSSFTFVTPPSITGISPLTGSTNGGTLVTIKGKDFTGATSLTIGGVEATSFTVVSAILITCITPARIGAGGVGIIVTTAGGQSKQFSFYNYITPAVITSLSPSLGSTAGGTIVTITGTNFTGATSVTINGKAATPIKVVDNTTITCKAPDNLIAGPVDVIVTTGGGPSSAFSSYTYVTPAVITSISPSFGTKAGGTSVTITGTNLTGASVVLFGLNSATNIIVVDNTTITCVTPVSANPVAVGVTLTTGGGLSNKFSSFTYR